MRYWFGYLTAGIFAAITWVLMQFGQRFSTLVDMIYPYVIRTLQGMLAEWTSSVDFPVWQVLAVALGVLILASLVLMLILKWNPIQWAGWVLAVFSGLYMLNTMMWGLNYYAGTLAEDMRLEVASYNLEELTEATLYYRDKANDLAAQIPRDAAGNPDFADFAQLAQQAGDGFHTLTYTNHYSIFAGSVVPVKELGWADLYTSMGVTGVTFGMTGESAVNPNVPDVGLPFAMAHEMAHRMSIAPERDANFAAFLACTANSDPQFQYSGYLMAFRYCYTALTSVDAQGAVTVSQGISQQLRGDMAGYTAFFDSRVPTTSSNLASSVNDAYLKLSGEEGGMDSYAEVCDLLVNWHIQTVVLPSITVEDSPFDPYDETQVDLSGIVNAR
ncbi:MAG TPA: DUF3810 domain-containing protein [Candidatus Faecousia intestinavium]|nr:DUF3810 domain-containing protein [Candidatus Faecousia intestinavium]